MRRPHQSRPVILSLLFFAVWLQAASPHVAAARQQTEASQTSSEPDSVEVIADSGQERTIDGVVRIVLLNAHVTQGDTIVYGDEVIQETKNQFLLTGNVRIVEKGDTVNADVVRYDGDNKIGHASGHVVVSDGSSTLTSISAVYYSDEKRAEFEEGVEYADSTTLLVSEKGRYWTEDAIADFFGNVRLRQEDLYLEADSIHYARDEDLTRATSNVFVDRYEGDVDSTFSDRSHWVDFNGKLQGFELESDRSILYSDVVRYDGRIDSSWVEGNVMLLRTNRHEASMDSLLVTSDAMVLTRSGDVDRVTATGSVVVAEADFSVIGDSLRYDRRTPEGVERFETFMYGRPHTWVNDSQITSDTLKIYGTAGSIDSLHAIQNLFVASLDTTLDRIQQLKGRTLVAYFEDDSLRTMSVSPNAEALYYIEPEEGEPAVAVKASGDRINFTFKHGAAEHVQVLSQIQGTLYPNEIIDQAESLAGYVWEPDRRPDLSVMEADLLGRQRDRIERQQVLPARDTPGSASDSSR